MSVVIILWSCLASLWKQWNERNRWKKSQVECIQILYILIIGLFLLVSIIGYKHAWKIKVCCLWRSLFNHIVWNTDKVVCLLFVFTSYFNIFALLQVHTECIIMKIIEWSTWKWGECCSTESRRLTELKADFVFVDLIII